MIPLILYMDFTLSKTSIDDLNIDLKDLQFRFSLTLHSIQW